MTERLASYLIPYSSTDFATALETASCLINSADQLESTWLRGYTFNFVVSLLFAIATMYRTMMYHPASFLVVWIVMHEIGNTEIDGIYCFLLLLLLLPLLLLL